MAANPRRPIASQVLPHTGFGLGLPTVTPMPTRQWERPAARVVQVVPIDWRPQGPQVSYGSSSGGSGGQDDAPATPCEDC